MSPSPNLSRRDLLKTLGAGLVTLGLTGLPFSSAQAQVPPPGPYDPQTPQPFTLPPLPYAADALEPHFDAATMTIHHQRHHQAYINNANRALAAYPDLLLLSGEQLVSDLDALPETLRSTVRNNVGGHLNHAFFWPLLAPPSSYRSGPLRHHLIETFGSLAAFQEHFTQAALGQFGSGWAWLVLKRDTLSIMGLPNQDSPLMHGAKPIIGLDVWEHAYYLHYQNRRADFVRAFWSVLNWDQAESNYSLAVGGC